MYINPEMGQRLAQTMLEEARSRTRSLATLRAACLEQQREPATVRGVGYARVAPVRETMRRWLARRPGLRPHAPKTTNC